ncbi:hypothetical protein BH09MYX1_BH09MYX1_47270 [soil metagenome]
MKRLRALAMAALVSSVAAVACGHAENPPLDHPLELGAAIDWAPAAGLQSIVIASPKAILAHPELLPPLAEVIPNESFDVFATRHGGIDARELDEIVVGSYADDRTLVLARGHLDPTRVEAAFGDRVTEPRRFVDQPGGPLSTVVRLEGSQGIFQHEMVIFGRQAVGYETQMKQQVPAGEEPVRAAHVGPLRAAELFALGKLKKASPVLHAAPLDATAKLVGEGVVRIFFPGPFAGGTEQGLAGLLKATTSVGVAVQPEARPDGKPALHVILVLTGAWGDSAPAAAARLGAALTTLTSSGLGRLCGVNQPLRGPDVRGQPDALFADMVIDAAVLAQGLHAAVASEVSEIMKF